MSKDQKAAAGKTPNPIDIEVGKRIRVYRQQAGLSQTDLGGALKLTFQQIQKYEKGTNRVAPSRLEIIARVCGVPVSAFLPSLDGRKGNSGPLPFAELQIHGAQDLLAAFGKIKSSKARAALVALADEMVRRGRRCLSNPKHQCSKAAATPSF